ncbi:MAG: hypothetical protein E7277_03950 [Lachnospiraceae bacterium]|jgi:cob(I)alamin adenosyltransferase|nr:hypothetical protein [Lachnospiraceae bacterium]
MGLLEAILIVVGVAFVIASFFVTDKLSDKDVEEIAQLSEAQLRIITDKQVEDAKKQVENALYEVSVEREEHSERLMEQVSNEKIMAISEYSDTVLDSINKTHNEVMFLYSMLNDKHTELTKLANDLSALQGEVSNYTNQTRMQMQESERVRQEQQMQKLQQMQELQQSRSVQQVQAVEASKVARTMETKPVIEKEQPSQKVMQEAEEKAPMFSNREKILACYRKGMNEVEIAKALALGIGEVRLVIDLYEE